MKFVYLHFWQDDFICIYIKMIFCIVKSSRIVGRERFIIQNINFYSLFLSIPLDISHSYDEPYSIFQKVFEYIRLFLRPPY